LPARRTRTSPCKARDSMTRSRRAAWPSPRRAWSGLTLLCLQPAFLRAMSGWCLRVQFDGKARGRRRATPGQRRRLAFRRPDSQGQGIKLPWFSTAKQHAAQRQAMLGLLLRACDEWRPRWGRLGGAGTATLAFEAARSAVLDLVERTQELPPLGDPGRAEAARQLLADAGALLEKLCPLVDACRLPGLRTLQVGRGLHASTRAGGCRHRMRLSASFRGALLAHPAPTHRRLVAKARRLLAPYSPPRPTQTERERTARENARRLRAALHFFASEAGAGDSVQTLWARMQAALTDAGAALPAAARHNMEACLAALQRRRDLGAAAPGHVVVVLAGCCRFNPAAPPGAELQTFGCHVTAGGSRADVIIGVSWRGEREGAHCFARGLWRATPPRPRKPPSRSMHHQPQLPTGAAARG
jgi:hypothetical protein